MKSNANLLMSKKAADEFQSLKSSDIYEQRLYHINRLTKFYEGSFAEFKDVMNKYYKLFKQDKELNKVMSEFLTEENLARFNEERRQHNTNWIRKNVG